MAVSTQLTSNHSVKSNSVKGNENVTYRQISLISNYTSNQVLQCTTPEVEWFKAELVVYVCITASSIPLVTISVYTTTL